MKERRPPTRSRAGGPSPTPEARSRLRVPKLGLAASAVLLGALVAFSLTHVGDARRFALLLERAEPMWILAALGFQLGTYLCAGAIWGRVAAAAGCRLPTTDLARLSIEKLGVDQLVPTGGLAGNVVVVRAMRRMGLPSATATEALLIDILSHYAAFVLAIVIALIVLVRLHGMTQVIAVPLGFFVLVVATVPVSIIWLLRHRGWKPGPRLARAPFLSRVLGALDEVSPERVWDARLLAVAATLQIGIFLLDAGTLWAMMKALATPVHPLTAFVAIVIATMAGTVSFLPGGIGGFETGSTAALALLGVPVEAALTGTLLLRGLTLWLPLVPGVVLAHRDLSAPMSSETWRG